MKLSHDSDIVIKLHDTVIIQRVQGSKPSEIKEQAEQAREKAAETCGSLAVDEVPAQDLSRSIFNFSSAEPGPAHHTQEAI